MSLLSQAGAVTENTEADPQAGAVANPEMAAPNEGSGAGGISSTIQDNRQNDRWALEGVLPGNLYGDAQDAFMTEMRQSLRQNAPKHRESLDEAATAKAFGMEQGPIESRAINGAKVEYGADGSIHVMVDADEAAPAQPPVPATPVASQPQTSAAAAPAPAPDQTVPPAAPAAPPAAPDNSEGYQFPAGFDDSVLSSLDRVRTKHLSPAQQAAIKAIAENRGLDPLAAIQQVAIGQRPDLFQAAQAATPPAGNQSPAAPVAQVNPLQGELDAQQSAIDAIKTQIKEAGQMSETDRVAELSLELDDARVAMTRLEKRAEAEAAQQNAVANSAWENQESGYLAQVNETYPALSVEGSTFATAAGKMQAMWKANNDPRLNSPDWPARLCQDLVALGIPGDAPATQSVPAAQPAAPAPAATRPTPAPGNVSQQSATTGPPQYATALDPALTPGVVKQALDLRNLNINDPNSDALIAQLRAGMKIGDQRLRQGLH